jgi:hypothetical protein
MPHLLAVLLLAPGGAPSDRTSFPGSLFLPLPPDFSGEHYQQSDFARSRPEKTAVIF